MLSAALSLAALAPACGSSGGATSGPAGDGEPAATTVAARPGGAAGDGANASGGSAGGKGGIELARRVNPCELVLEAEAEAVVDRDLRPGQPTVYNGTQTRQCAYRGQTNAEGRVRIEFDAFATTKERFERFMHDSVAASKLTAVDGVGQAAFFVDSNLGTELVALHPNGLRLTVRVDGVPPAQRPPVEKFIPAVKAGFTRMPSP